MPYRCPKGPLSATPIPQKVLTLSREVYECKPLARGQPDDDGEDTGWQVSAGFKGRSRGTRRGERQGLTLIHFSAQPEPFLTQNTP